LVFTRVQELFSEKVQINSILPVGRYLKDCHDPIIGSLSRAVLVAGGSVSIVVTVMMGILPGDEVVLTKGVVTPGEVGLLIAHPEKNDSTMREVRTVTETALEKRFLCSMVVTIIESCHRFFEMNAYRFSEKNFSVTRPRENFNKASPSGFM